MVTIVLSYRAIRGQCRWRSASRGSLVGKKKLHGSKTSLRPCNYQGVFFLDKINPSLLFSKDWEKDPVGSSEGRIQVIRTIRGVDFTNVRTLIFVRLTSLGQCRWRSERLGWYDMKTLLELLPKLLWRHPRLAKRTKIKIRTVSLCNYQQGLLPIRSQSLENSNNGLIPL